MNDHFLHYGLPITIHRYKVYRHPDDDIFTQLNEAEKLLAEYDVILTAVQRPEKQLVVFSSNLFFIRKPRLFDIHQYN
jgi:hypothetical protein